MLLDDDRKFTLDNVCAESSSTQVLDQECSLSKYANNDTNAWPTHCIHGPDGHHLHSFIVLTLQ